MSGQKCAQEWEIVQPTEANGYRLFPPELESDPLVAFHITQQENLSSIVETGFQSAHALGVGDLASVSYAKTSARCLAHINCEATRDLVIFAVRFDTLQQHGVREEPSDIHVFDITLQPTILGYCRLPQGFRVR